jgi:hypothetical protein
MDSERLDNVTGWSSRPFADGYDGLRDLADREFSGAVTEGMAWAFFLNGRVVGVFDGSIEDFESADGTAYEAPHPALPLLYAMQETGGETRAKYYTNDTPISEVDQTLSAGNFTGYVELSENVLSGDYYTVYHGGRSMSAAFVGSSKRLVTGDEAFETADDEVGIYEVKTVPVEIIDIPGGDESEDDAGGAAGAAGAAGAGAAGSVGSAGAADATDADADDAADAGADDADTDDETDVPAGPEPSEATPGESTADDTTTPDSDVTLGDSAGSTDASDDIETDATDESAPDADHEPSATEPAATEPTSTDDERPDTPGDTPATGTDDASATGTDDASATGTDDASATATDDASASTGSGGVTFGDGEQSDDASVGDLADEVIADTSLDEEPLAEESDDESGVFSAESEWRETTTIPALDPEESIDADGGSRGSRTGGGGRGRRQRGRSGATDHAGSGRASSSTGSDGSGSRRSQRQTGGSSSRNGVSREQAEQLKEKLEASEEARQQAEAARKQLASELESVREERDTLASERDELEAERDELEARASQLDSRVTELEAQVERLESELAEARAEQPDPEHAISAREALDGTNLFVRYDSKSGGTLEKAHDGQVDREEVNTNLRLEHHTSFETDNAHVDGQPYEAFLRESIEYGFARWVVQDLLYEIRDTGHEPQLQDLYDAIPKIDRAELNGSVSLTYTENGEEHREQQRFDVVLRDRMGNPLLVANLNDSRDAASESMMRELVENARRLAETSDSLGAGFLVTASFFAPEALETASEATSGGLLSRSKRESFVKLSRKQGFHLCLVETRNGDFHLNVPEL